MTRNPLALFGFVLSVTGVMHYLDSYSYDDLFCAILSLGILLVPFASTTRGFWRGYTAARRRGDAFTPEEAGEKWFWRGIGGCFQIGYKTGIKYYAQERRRSTPAFALFTGAGIMTPWQRIPSNRSKTNSRSSMWYRST